jgi:hypothetical protein
MTSPRGLPNLSLSILFIPSDPALLTNSECFGQPPRARRFTSPSGTVRWIPTNQEGPTFADGQEPVALVLQWKDVPLPLGLARVSRLGPLFSFSRRLSSRYPRYLGLLAELRERGTLVLYEHE